MGSILGLLGVGGGGGGGGGGNSSSATSGAPVSVNNTTTSGGGLNIWEVAIALGMILILGLFITLNRR